MEERNITTTTAATESQAITTNAGTQEAAISDERIPGKLIGAIVAVGSLAFIGILTETVMTVLFPQLMREFNVDTATVQWITTIYLLVVAATMPLSSYLNRRFKHRTLFLAAVALAVLGSLIMIVGHAFPVILIARVIQGMGSGVATPLMINIILEQSPKSKVGRLMGVGSLVITVAPAIGPTVGGAVSSILPWRAIFVIVIPIILLVSLPVGLKCVEQHRPTEEARLNSLQFVSIVLALCGLVMFLNQAGVAVSAAVSGGSATVSGGSATVSAVFAVVSLIVGLGALLFFGWSSKRSFSPLIRLGWLRDPMVLLHLIAYMLLPIVGIGFGYVITNVAQLSLGTSAFLSGALVLPGALIGAFFAPVGGMLYDRFGPVRPILGAFFAAICGPILLLVFSMRLTPVTLAGFYFIFGFGYSLGFSNIMTNALRNIAPQFMPDGNAVFNTCLQFGGAAGTALFSTILSVAQAGAGEEGGATFRHATAVGGSWTFATMIGIVAIAICCLIAAFRIGAKRNSRL
ncbi:MFS transporter [Bifidobacterium pseudocatenulatum]|uniref:Transporter, major facilitator family protein n=2 Tax=Bifidobacterium pseudocatenulatum TaxID=28026 RepID=C0BVG2_BIFPS|nr:MFS transporter [Bifidobacterium pseudocatenulatum]EEG69953.1 transporter, major facilitator family protein [Bifidobacterium pseudocatenulatum DSM 20438 = JCM 1200 = LMG 10505]KFI75668.1 major facilitator transporter [Bifidobacterium pseudocatenulatum DSM 20438 = JCM 1200 = LMG 10505]BAR03331.1 transport protein [Bifidobacterium pseudocatenulatum DSM 20438 = JCM 1200 = LMG 10505]